MRGWLPEHRALACAGDGSGRDVCGPLGLQPREGGRGEVAVAAVDVLCDGRVGLPAVEFDLRGRCVCGAVRMEAC